MRSDKGFGPSQLQYFSSIFFGVLNIEAARPGVSSALPLYSMGMSRSWREEVGESVPGIPYWSMNESSQHSLHFDWFSRKAGELLELMTSPTFQVYVFVLVQYWYIPGIYGKTTESGATDFHFDETIKPVWLLLHFTVILRSHSCKISGIVRLWYSTGSAYWSNLLVFILDFLVKGIQS